MLSGYKILVAEDNTLNQKIATYILQKQDAIVVTVPNGVEAIKELEQNKYDLVLMDLQMPQMDGWETSLYIRNEMKSDIPIIALSASNLESDRIRCTEAGMDGCISKPLDANQLSGIILDITRDNRPTT